MKDWSKLAVVFMVLLFSCGGYHISMPAPGLDDSFSSLFPAKIESDFAETYQVLDLGGIESFYRTDQDSFNKYIYITRHEDIEKIRGVFMAQIYPEFQKLTRYALMDEDGELLVIGTAINGEEWVAWTNKFYLFALKAKDKGELDKLVDAFPYISR